MAPCRYKALLSYLPGMATVVNSFQSPDVQKAVFDELLRALHVRMEQEGVPPSGKRNEVRSVAELRSLVAQVAGGKDEEPELDLVSGDSIHAVGGKG